MNLCDIAFIAWLFTFACNATAQSDLEVYFGNLHSHTSYSDGQSVPQEAYTHARDVAGLDFLAITEHNHGSAGGVESHPDLYNGNHDRSLISAANRFTVDGEFVAIFGQEVSSISSGNHANVFEVRDVVRTSEVANGAWRDLLNSWIPNHPDVHGNTALVLLNHPATSSSPNNLEYGRDDFSSQDAWIAALDQHAQLINIINGPSHNGSNPGRPSESEYRRYLNLGMHVGPTADQDNHRPNWGSAADTRTAVIASELTKSVILDALRSRHVYATEDRNLEIIARIDGHLIGSRISGSAAPSIGDTLPISLTINDPNEGMAEYEIEVFSDQVGGDEDAGVVLRETVSGNGSHSISGLTYGGGQQYVFLKITQLADDVDGHDRAWTAPVWFEGSASSPTPPTPPTSSIRLTVDERAETATIFNGTANSLDLSNWLLVSERGGQIFRIPENTSISPNHSLTILSGPGANSPQQGQTAWTTSNVWANSGDPGRLENSEGAVIARSDATGSGSTPAPQPIISLILKIDEVDETAEITNLGSTSVDISGWILVSERGGQTFTFPAGTTILSGSTLTVVSGPAAAHTGQNEIAWTTSNIWRNAGDPGRLESSEGIVVAND